MTNVKRYVNISPMIEGLLNGTADEFQEAVAKKFLSKNITYEIDIEDFHGELRLYYNNNSGNYMPDMGFDWQQIYPANDGWYYHTLAVDHEVKKEKPLKQRLTLGNIGKRVITSISFDKDKIEVKFKNKRTISVMRIDDRTIVREWDGSGNLNGLRNIVTKRPLLRSFLKYMSEE